MIRLKINHLLFILFIISWNIGDLINNQNDDFKYIFLFINILYLICNYKRNKKLNQGKLLLNLLFFIVPLFIYSLFLQVLAHSFSFQTIKDFLYILSPILYVYLIVESEEEGNFDFYFNVEFFAATLTFLLRALPILTPSNILSISFLNSYSPFEGIGNADGFFVLFFYYAINKKKSMKWISFILLFLSFKRLHVVFAVMLIILQPFFEKNKDKKVNSLIFYLTIAFFLVSPSVLSLICNNNFENWFYKEFGMKLDAFTMGRVTTLNYVIDSNRTNLGLGSISDFLAKARMINPYLADDLHNDIMRIYLEGTVVSLWLMVVNYFSLTKRNLYNYLMVLFAFLVMFSSHILTTCIFWIFAFLFIMSNNLNMDSKREE
ncbi:hypothetical protein [Streptococcus infantarius]|uniref:hypothetical protein n=1 Tax=Streptococcus infantarius TaxID=102684 RepID=UPI0022E0E4E9|nr:hypothetical protein [Streptococcus infantarius]